MIKLWSPQEYDEWYDTPLGSLSDMLEKKLVFSLLALKSGEIALDVGCGTGNYTIELARKGTKVIGIDRSEEMLGCAREKAEKNGFNIPFQVADAQMLPFLDNSFDLIVSNGLFCFLKEPEKTLMEVNRNY